ncbi:MAG: hypothetical protein K0R34_697 [Herbinix sp.]|nr:hypothetical protein [Herbinix sp.]
MKNIILSLLKDKQRRSIILGLFMIVSMLLVSTTTTKAGNDWGIGESGTISPIPPPKEFGGQYWVMSEATVFLLNPFPLPTFEPVNGQTKIIKDFENTNPAYGDYTVAIIPYDLGAYIKRHGFTNLSVVKRSDAEDPMSQQIISDSKQMKAVLVMERSYAKSSIFTDGVYYDKLVDLDKNNTLKSKWYDLIGGTSISIPDADKKCEEVWCYITKFNYSKDIFEISDRIDEYLHIPTDKEKFDANHLTNAGEEIRQEIRLRYIDFLMTVYTQVRDSVVASKWKKIIDEYIELDMEEPENDCNIAISAGFAARGWAEVDGKTKLVNIISGCQDFIEASLCIDSDYSLTNKAKADEIAGRLLDQKKETTYYNRLLEALSSSVKKQVKNKTKVNRTYADVDGLWGSAIISRMLQNKPIIDGTTVSWKSGEWGKEDYIEHIYLKSKFYGTMLIPAFPISTPPTPEATLRVESSIAPGKNFVEIKNGNVLNDQPKLFVSLKKTKEKAKWDLLFGGNQHYKIQVAFTRTPTAPGINIDPKKYVSKPETIYEPNLTNMIDSGKIPINEWADKSLLSVVINDEQTLKYKYKATVTIYYSNTTTKIDEMKKLEVAPTNEASITYYKPYEPERDQYISTASAYSELKEGTIYNESFEAMAGVPTTRTLYFASGGSEFMVELEVEYDKDEKATRTYRSVFASNDCEFKEGDTAPNMILGEQSANLHGGGTYTRTWSGSIPNKAQAVTKLHEATCPADPDLKPYEADLKAAEDFVTTVNKTKLSHTADSDDKTREYTNWGAHISTNSKSLPQTTNASVSCSKKDPVPPDENGNGGSPGVPCGNEQATANPGGAGSYTITVTWTVPAHVLCGPCCTHVLPAVEDTWKQNISFDTLKIIDVRVWKIESSYVDGMEEITYEETDKVKATIKQGDPNIFFNIANANTSQAGRLRYSLQQQQHDAVTWYEKNSSGEEKRSNKCNGLSGTLCSSNPIPVAANQGHINTWAKGILYSNNLYTNDVNHQAIIYSGQKTACTGDSTDTVDKGTEEYNRFTTRRNMDNKVTVISDMLIFQTSSGDQAAVYFESTQSKKSQVNYDDINVTFAQMWASNPLCADKWTEDEINIGSYNGEYYNTSSKYKGNGDGARITTAFDNDLSKVSSGDELNLARVVSSKSFTAGAANKSTPSAGQYRMARPNALRILIDNIRQNPINPNGEYFPNQSYVYFRNILSYTGASATGLANYYESELTTNDMGDYGYTMKSSYKVSEGREGNVNSIVVHNPVSVEDAMIVSLPTEMDQRTTLPTGSAQSLLEKISAAEVCPLSPGLCEFRVHNCKYGTDRILSSFNFEQVSTKAMKDPVSGAEQPITVGSETGEISNDSLILENFTSEFTLYDITSRECTVSNSLERLVVEINDKNSYVELALSADTSDITAVRVSFTTSGKSAKSYLSYSTEKNGTYRGNVEKAIIPEGTNQIVEYNVGALSSWRELGTVKRLRLNLDGDNTGAGTYIITKIELIPAGLNTGGAASYYGSEDDTSIIRSLIVPASGQTMEYKLIGGFTIDKNNIFGTGRSLSVNGNGGTRLAIPLTDIGITYQKLTNLKMEANVNIPASSSTDNMLFSLKGLGFYVPRGDNYGYFITSNGAIIRANSVIVGSKLKLGVVFSLGSINECKIYVNNTLVTSYTTISNGSGTGDITEDMVGENVNIGSWLKDSLYSSQFVMDNLTITKMAGSTTHTAACYTTYKEHSYQVSYLDNPSQIFNYTGAVQTYTAPETGYFRLESWGASGGGSTNQIVGSHAGLGGYTSGEIYLTKGQTLQIYVGGQGAYSSALGTGGGYNGGGNGGPGGYGGGGATDIRTDSSITNRVIVAGGGGGADNAGGAVGGIDDGSGGAGGGLVGDGAYIDGKIAFQTGGGSTLGDISDLSKWNTSGGITWDSSQQAFKGVGNTWMYLKPEYAYPIDSNKTYTIKVTAKVSNSIGDMFYWGGNRLDANKAHLEGYGGTYDYCAASAVVTGNTDWVTYTATKQGTSAGYNGWGTDTKYFALGGLLNYWSANRSSSQITWIKDIELYEDGVLVQAMSNKLYKLGSGESVTTATDTGGAGGGYYGGYVTNNNNGGGGGGSGYIGGVSNGSTLSGVRYDNGMAKITRLSHVHSTTTCPYEVTQNNSHTHNATCITNESSELMNALTLADRGDITMIKSLVGDAVYNRLNRPSSLPTTYNAHIHTQNCTYTPVTSPVNYSPVSLTTQHHTSNGGYTAATSNNAWTSNPGDPQRLNGGYNTVTLTSGIGANRYAQINLTVGCITYQGSYSNFQLLINGSWMTVNSAAAAGLIINPSVAVLYPGYYTPHPYQNNLMNGGDTGLSTWNGLSLSFYTGSNVTITAINLNCYYPSYGQSRPGDGIWVNSGGLNVTTATGTWNCNNLPLNTYSDIAIVVEPVLRNVGSSGSQTYNYNGGVQTFTAPATGTYNLEVWGAQGGRDTWSGSSNKIGGLGGYSKGTVTLSQGEIIYVVVGGAGGDTLTSGVGGYNGGSSSVGHGSGGGGATHIAKANGILSTLSSNRTSVLIVAGGGGGIDYGGSWLIPTGHGGGTTGGLPRGVSSQATQTSGYAFGQGQPIDSSTQTGGGGGGWYGGYRGISEDQGSGAGSWGGGGSGYIAGVASGSTQIGVRSGDGAAKISWDNPYYYTGPDYIAPPARLANVFGALNGTAAGLQSTIALLAQEYANVPQTINGKMNPIFSCWNKFNVHVCTEACRNITILNCNEPHHFGSCYDYDNEICWDACGNDNNHKNAEVMQTETADGNTIHVGTFICLDNYFQVYFPNVGDFYGNGAYGIEYTSRYRGKGYHDNMATLEWLREKRVRFGFDVLFNRNGVWEQYRAGEWITLPIRNNGGRELSYYDFYCILANNEKVAASVEFQAEAINCTSSPGGKEDPYLGDSNTNSDCPMYYASEYMTNRERFKSLWAYHSAYKRSYTDVIGRIGNFIIEDTEDFRYSNFFKQTSVDGWIVEGIIREVNADISKNYLSWFRNDGSYGRDIRGVTVSPDTDMYDTYGTQSWTDTASSASLPLQGAINNVASLKDCQLKLGYNVLFDISTIGDYHNNLQVVPYFYALNLDTNTMTPVDVYIAMDKEYKPINYFGLMSEYVDANNNYTADFYTLKDKLYDYVMNLDWDNESRRRNYSSLEEVHTKFLGEHKMEPVTDAFGTTLTYKYLTIPYGNYYSLGTLQMLLPGLRARTFIGSSTVNTVNINGGNETNINHLIDNSLFWHNGQRWHLTLGAPSSAVFVPYRNNRHVLPTDEVIGADGKEIAAYEEIKNGNYVILMTADIKAIGKTYVLAFDQGSNNGVLRIKGKTYSFGEDLPNVFAVYDAEGSAVVDIDFTGTH